MPEIHGWTASLMAERWSRFGLECRQMFEQSCVPERFQSVDLNRLGDAFPAPYRAMAKLLMEQIDKPRLLAIGGDRGVGKTALACGLVKEFCRHGKPSLYKRTAEYFTDLTSTEWAKKDAVRAKYLRPSLLVLDEVQVRDSDRNWQDNELTTLIDKRYGEEKATLLLSNMKPDALVNDLGESVHRRLIEEGGILEAAWPRLRTIQVPAGRAQ